MLIKLTNKTTNVSVSFLEREDIKNQYGSVDNLVCYPNFVNENLTFRFWNAAGFFDNPVVNPFATSGVNEDGVNFKGNHFDPKQLSFAFENVFSISGNNTIGLSPNNILMSLILIKNDILQVDVTTNGEVFTQDFFVNENTSLENGVIGLTSASSGVGIYWKNGYFNNEFLYYSYGAPKIDMNLPQIIIGETFEVNTITQITSTAASPKFTFYWSTLGTWEKIILTNTTNGQNFTYEPFDNTFNAIIVDSSNLTVTNENGVNLFGNFLGDFINLDVGLNVLEWQVIGENVPQDMKLTISYEKLLGGIQ